ncbi:MAG: cation:proton antiporter [Armatimonadetes bacterium]|nr:cation:proton antiporter [Armatimonadota bacterium]
MWAVVALVAASTAAWAGESGSHSDPVGPVLLEIVLLLGAAKLGGAVFLRLGQPAVLGELVAGVVLGNMVLLTGDSALLTQLSRDVTTPGTPMDILARLGVVLLLFTVGLESDLGAMLKVGVASFLVASIGVVCPFVLGWGVSVWLLPGQPDPLTHIFIGATLCATSVGITARVFQELGRLDQDESRIVLGAAVIDDVMGLVVLAVVSAMITAKDTGQALAVGSVLGLVLLAVGFLVVSVLGGRWLAPRAYGLASRLQGDGLLLITSLAICFLLSAAAGAVGLAPIVGAFAAGLLLDELHYREMNDRQGTDHKLEELLAPLTALLVPLFFVQMGMTVHLSTFGEAGVLGFAALLTVAAILGKQSCGLVVGKGLDRLSIGVGMIPRGEVGLIFAAIGRQLRLNGEPVINDVANSAVVIMVIVTTMVTPPVLAWTLRRGDRRRGVPSAA